MTTTHRVCHKSRTWPSNQPTRNQRRHDTSFSAMTLFVGSCDA